ncbi:hypothetical protein [Streptomyces canus]|uniref:hypothetical protein n=1 Tax=Streptomyces canus TaxID=58343 RepID=UPI0027885587|nr:hypothetical protein [Streptomyces canus]MDQ0760629.1 hypothetical protein [Streptomyces canus]
MHHSHVDGVPVLRSSEPGPLHATLRFGVGARDETYRTRGVTRQVAALAAHETRRRLPVTAEPVVYTGVEETRFTVSGTPQEVTDILRTLCRALGEPPTGRPDETAFSCDDEAAVSLHPLAAAALNARYGAQAAGLLGQECTGCLPPTPDMLRTHAATWFTRANAVLTLTGPDPVGLRLPLPPGERPHRSAPKARYPRASWTHRGIEGVAVSLEAPAGSAAVAVAHRIVRERMTAALARRSASAAPAEAATVPHDSDTDVRLLFTPAPAGDTEEVAATVWSEALRLARIEPAQDEVDRHRDGPGSAGAQPCALDMAARTALFGTPCPLEGVTPGDVRDAWQRAMAGAQLVVPEGLLLHLAGPDGRRLWCTSCWTWDELPPWGEAFHEPLVKRAFRRAGERHWTVLTPEAVVTCRTGVHHALRFDDVVALQRWGPERVLIGRCGCDIGIDPAWYRGGRRLVRAVDEAVPAELAFDGAEGGRPPEGRPPHA